MITARVLCFFSSLFVSTLCLAQPAPHPWYAGIHAGYGNTNWHMLLPHCNGDAACQYALSVATPVGAIDGGIALGANLGYQMQPDFAIELSYTHLPTTTLHFAPYSNYVTFNNQETSIKSNVYAVSLLAKFSAPIFHGVWRASAHAGAALTHRADQLAKLNHINPSFGIGINRRFSNRYQFELAFQYIAGFEHSTTTPASEYVPFITLVMAKLSYQFG